MGGGGGGARKKGGIRITRNEVGLWINKDRRGEALRHYYLQHSLLNSVTSSGLNAAAFGFI